MTLSAVYKCPTNIEVNFLLWFENPILGCKIQFETFETVAFRPVKPFRLLKRYLDIADHSWWSFTKPISRLLWPIQIIMVFSSDLSSLFLNSFFPCHDPKNNLNCYRTKCCHFPFHYCLQKKKSSIKRKSKSLCALDVTQRQQHVTCQTKAPVSS